jgi:glycosyltransferase involved in cell wall biosynthesis
LLKEFVSKDAAVRIEPVYYCSGVGRYRYAREFMSRFLEVSVGGLGDDIADIGMGDGLLCLDLNPADVHRSADYLRDLSHAGVRVAFVVYDLLPVRHPDCFVEGAEEGHRRWLGTVLDADMAICISHAVADDLRAYIRETAPGSRVEITTFPLGADFRHYPDDRGTAGIGGADLDGAPTFLMVGTLEPRKEHALVLDAFERLWTSGKDVQLCIVGKLGWKVENLAERIRQISAAEPRLKWLENADDESLARLYRSASCLVAASRDEGYGLPIIEAAQFNLPVIARDIPVFREVGGDWVDYFPRDASAEDLAKHIVEWLDGAHSSESLSADPPRIFSWKQSAEALLELVSAARVGPESQTEAAAA